jgi:hypothetical protein
MPLSADKLAKIQQTYKRAQVAYEQGTEFKPKSGTYEFRFREIAGAQDYVFQEVYEHQHPGNQKGFGYCTKSMGLHGCFYCDILEALSPLAETDPTLQNYLSQLSTGKPKYAFEVLWRELDSDIWSGPQMWKMRLDMFLKFQAYFSKRWGDPTEIAYEVAFMARKRLFNGKPVFDITSVAPITDPQPLPEEVINRKPLNIMQMLQQRDPESLTESLLDGPMGPYLRRVLESEAPAQETPKPTVRRVAKATPKAEVFYHEEAPPEEPQKEAPPEEPQKEAPNQAPRQPKEQVLEGPENDPQGPPLEESETPSEEPQETPKARMVRRVSTPAQVPSPVSPVAPKGTPTISPLARARSLMGMKGTE